jgi:hypothetical protein
VKRGPVGPLGEGSTLASLVNSARFAKRCNYTSCVRIAQAQSTKSDTRWP